MIELTAPDGQKLQAYCTMPAGTPRGGLIVGQELFGVNQHIRNVSGAYAADGYAVLAPRFYDRSVPGGFAVGYSQEELDEARKVLPNLKPEGMLLDIQAAQRFLAQYGKVGMVGYCSGGSAAWVGATRGADLACAISYYGGWIVRMLDTPPLCPVMLHWGEVDHTIPLSDVAKIEAAYPEIASYVYKDAKHGFNCDMRAAFQQEASTLARARSIDFLRQHVG